MRSASVCASAFALALSAASITKAAELERQNKMIVERFVAAGNAMDLAALDQLVAPDFVRHCEATPEIQVASLEPRSGRPRGSPAGSPRQRASSAR